MRRRALPAPRLAPRWWRHYSAKRTLAVHVAKTGDRLVGALPMCWTRRFGLRVTSSWEERARHSPICCSRRGRTGHCGTARCAHHDVSVDYADLFGMPRDSRLGRCAPVSYLDGAPEAPVLDLRGDWEAICTDKLSSKARSERRRHRRRLKDSRGRRSFNRSTPGELGLHPKRRSVHALRWKGRRETSGQ
jgi:CelD/BcsL family acetyltransferase involved in cellulose biosynthesis